MERSVWNSIISGLPNPHFLQTYEWGQVKAKYGWVPLYLVWTADGKFSVLKETDHSSLNANHCIATALILKRQILRNGFAARLSILYSPKGPLLDWSNEALRHRVLKDLQSFAKKEGAIFFKMDPDVVLGTGLPNSDDDVVDLTGQVVMSELNRSGWRYSSDQIQFKNTVLIDLRPSEEELLARMKQKTRYNIRLAQKKNVTVRVGIREDFGMLYKMYAETSLRDGFVIRDEDYYKTVWTTFTANLQSPISNYQLPITNYREASLWDQFPFAEPLIAEIDREPVAAIFVFYFAGRAYYVYGMSREAHREKMPAYLLQWEAITRAKANGCTVYDLWGAPDVFDDRDSMWGVYRFKEGFGGKVVRTLGAWDFAPNSLWYKLYSEIIPRLLDVMRSRGKARTRQSLGGAQLPQLPFTNYQLRITNYSFSNQKGSSMKEVDRLHFAHLPTPIEELPRLTEHLHGPRIVVKRDDLTGLAFGGNKTRKLEFLVAEALDQGAKTLITGGALQSNHCRQTAAAAARFGLDCILVLNGEMPGASSANLLLDQIFGAEIVTIKDRALRDRTLQETYDKALQEGRKPYLVTYGGSSPTGALGYAFAMQEFLGQNVHADWILFGTSSGGTHAGLVLGQRVFGYQGKVLGISIDEPEEWLKTRVSTLASDASERLGERIDFRREDVLANEEYCKAGYGVLTDAEREAVKLFAKYEGLLLDPVYTGRATAGMIDLIRKGFFNKDETILFWHTGGQPALFAEKYANRI